MSADPSSPASLERVASGVPGLDVILRGGLLRGGVYLIKGQPGTGKTVLGNQICHEHAAAGGRAIFLTLLTESHARMLAHLREMRFFHPECMGTSLHYVSGYEALEKGQLKELLALVRKVVREHRASLLVIDGMATTGGLAQTGMEMKKFVHELQVLVEMVGCTTLMLTGQSKYGDGYPQRTMVDGLFRLGLEQIGIAAARTIQVLKCRGSPVVLGRHFFEITGAGITIHPRTEALLGRDPRRPAEQPGRPPLGLGVSGLDAMLGGGLRPGSMTLLLGPPGSGKTLLGLSFLCAGARAGEPGLCLGFAETPAELARNADGIGAALSGHLKGGLIDIIWQPPLGLIADALAERLLGAVRARGVRRLFVDGMGAFQEAMLYPERMERFAIALCNELRAQGVTAIFSDEAHDLHGAQKAVSARGLAAALDNVILTRHVERGGRMHRVLSVLKMREGPGDPMLREYSIGRGGFYVSPTGESAEALLAGGPGRSA